MRLFGKLLPEKSDTTLGEENNRWRWAYLQNITIKQDTTSAEFGGINIGINNITSHLYHIAANQAMDNIPVYRGSIIMISRGSTVVAYYVKYNFTVNVLFGSDSSVVLSAISDNRLTITNNSVNSVDVTIINPGTVRV